MIDLWHHKAKKSEFYSTWLYKENHPLKLLYDIVGISQGIKGKTCENQNCFEDKITECHKMELNVLGVTKRPDSLLTFCCRNISILLSLSHH